MQIGATAPVRVSAKRLGELTGLVVGRTRHNESSALHFSAGGGCSCDLLGKKSDPKFGTWRLNDEHLPKLAAAVRVLGKEAKHFVFLAWWLGGESEPPRRAEHLSAAKLATLVERNTVGNNVVYVVGRGS